MDMLIIAFSFLFLLLQQTIPCGKYGMVINGPRYTLVLN